MAKQRLVIDVNVFLSRLFFESKIGEKILNSIKDELFVLLSCDELVSELKYKVGYFLQKRLSFKKQEIEFWLKYLVEISNFIQLTSTLKICRDPKDDYLVNLAIDGLARFLITRDKDLLEIEMEKVRKIVITPEKFVEILRKQI